MKTYILLSIPGIFFFTSANAQYEAGDIDFSLGGGIGLYSAKSNDPADSSTGIGAANNLWNLTGNYAIIPELSIGYTFERNGFLGGNDSAGNDTYANSNNFKLNVIFRMVNGEKNALSLQSMVGMSVLKFGDNATGDEVKSTGMTYEFGLTYQHLFGEHFGYYLNGAYASYRYSKITDQDGDVWRTNDDSQNVILTLSGGTLRLGLVYRL